MLPNPYRRRRSGIGGNAAATWRGDPASTAMTSHPNGLMVVLGEERLLQRRLAGDEVQELVTGGRPDHRGDRATDPHPEDVVLRADLRHAGQRLELGRRNRSGEPKLDLVVG